MLLSGKDRGPGIGHGRDERVGGRLEEREAVAAREDERRNANAASGRDRHGVVAHDPRIVCERVGDGLLGRPPRLGLREGRELGRHAHHVDHEEGGGVTAAALGNHAVQLLDGVGRRAALWIQVVGRLPEHQLVHRCPGRGSLECQRSAGRGSIEMGPAAGELDDRLDVLDLPLDRVRQRVATVASTATVEVVRRHARRQDIGELGIRAAIDRPAADEDDRGATAGDIDRQLGAVLRGDGGRGQGCHRSTPFDVRGIFVAQAKV